MIGTKDQLNYQLPTVSPDEFAAKADALLSECAQDFPSLLPYLLEPSNLLAIAGLRAESPYVMLGDDGQNSSLVQSKRFQLFLRKYGLALVQEYFDYGEGSPTPIYFLINLQALHNLPRTYGFNESWWLGDPIELDYLNYGNWYTQTQSRLVQLMEDGQLPNMWLRDWWAPHNILFGMLLGYPGVAVCSSCDAEASYRVTNEVPDTVQIEFAYPENIGAKVSCDVLRADAGSPQIRHHRKLWQAYFDLVYSTWGSRLLGQATANDLAA
jgi:hypothetical protein